MSVISDRSLGWQGFTNERIVSPRRRYVIVNMLNPPPDDEIAKMHNELPEPVDNVVLTVTIPRNENLDKVYFIASGTPNHAEPLNLVGDGKTKQVSVPKFEIWAMVVLELTGRYTVPQVPPTFTEPMSAEEKKELALWQEKRITIHTADDPLNPSPYEPIPEKLHVAETATDDMAPGDHTFGGHPGLDILLLRGLHHYSYRLPEAIRTVAPKVRITSVTGKDAPRDDDSFFQYDIVILVDYHGHLKDEARQALSDLVAAGGKLMVFGGLDTGGLRYYQNIPLPVKVQSQRDIYRLPKPLALGAHKDDPSVGRPLVYYFHAAQPKRDAIVRWWADKIPMLLEHQVGKGTTLLFVGTVLGEAQAKDQTPFWDSNTWPEILGTAIVNQ